MGTPVYMAPEALRGARALHTAADVYSFAVIAFELLEGRRPLAEEEALARAFGRFDRALASPVARMAIHGVLADLFEAALSVDPERRPTAAQLAAALDSHASQPG